MVCLSEHFIKIGEECFLNLNNNFYLVAIFTRQEQRYGCTCILCKDGYKSSELDVLKELTVEKHFYVCGI